MRIIIIIGQNVKPNALASQRLLFMSARLQQPLASLKVCVQSKLALYTYINYGTHTHTHTHTHTNKQTHYRMLLAHAHQGINSCKNILVKLYP